MDGIELPEHLKARNVQGRKILCCECGLAIDPNPLNTCMTCIQSKIDISEDLSKENLLQFCGKCERYLQPPGSWVAAELESRQLLGVCLKRIKGLSKVHLIDAGFQWTEAHSKRVKVKLVIQKEVNGAKLQQNCLINYEIVNQICDDCQRVEAKDYWNCVVQVRQHVHHKKTFYFLEQLMLKCNAHKRTVSIKKNHDGIDFFFAQLQDGRKLVEFLQTVVPCRYNTSKRLISHDVHTNVYNNKHTFSVEIVPICKDDVVCLPQKLSKENGSIGPICICRGITQQIQLIDPRTLKMVEFDASTYWRSPFRTICGLKKLKEYTIMDIDRDTFKPHVYGRESHKHELADVWAVKTSEMTSTHEHLIHTKTHLGRLLNAGDNALGFHIATSNVNDENLDVIKPDELPDLILVKKLYGDRTRRNKKRKWKLKRMKMEAEGSVITVDDRDYNDFLEDLEEDPYQREQVNIYKNPNHVEPDTDTEEAGETPEVSLQEMLDELKIQDEPMATDE